MKKALVIAIACMLVLAGGALVSAQTFTGSWDVTFTVDMHDLTDACPDFWWDIFSLSSELVLDYTVGGFVFESKSSFDAQHGFNAQEFSAAGSLGAFSLAAKMDFLPSAVLTNTQGWWPAPLGSPVANNPWYIYNNPGDACDDDPAAASNTACKTTVLTLLPGCSLDVWAETTGPAFKDFELTADVSIAGLEVGGLFLMNGWAGTTTVTDIFFWDVCTEDLYEVDMPTNAYWANVPQTASGTFALATNVVQTGTCTVPGSTPIGAGSRLMLAGSVGGMTVTSFTYFNMTESDAAADTDSGCPVLGKKGDYAVAAGCGLGFTEEYFMVEGIPFCCGITLDAALKLVCPGESETLTCVCEDELVKTVQTGGMTVLIYMPSWDEDCTFTYPIVGFEYLQFLLNDIPFIPGFYDLTVSVKFGTTTKEFALCGAPSFGLDTCFSVTLIPNWEEDESHNGIPNKFTGIDIKDFSLTCEFPGAEVTFTTVLYDLPTNALKTISSDEMLRFLVPTGCAAWCPPIWDADDDGDLEDLYDGIFVEYWDTPKYKYYAWETLGIVLGGDACCGGAYEITIDNYIGKEYEANPEFCGCICIEGYEKECCCEDEEAAVYHCEFTQDANYTEIGQINQLFSWMATDVDVSVSLFSSFTLTVGADVSFRGWETFSLGFGFIW